nr:hypothetical protein [Escherichia coli]
MTLRCVVWDLAEMDE